MTHPTRYTVKDGELVEVQHPESCQYTMEPPAITVERWKTGLQDYEAAHSTETKAWRAEYHRAYHALQRAKLDLESAQQWFDNADVEPWE